jgi:DNA-binding transcriptional regulator YhcF (GntR family)
MWFSISEDNPEPIYQQIVQQVRQQVAVGQLKEGEELPSVRELAESLGVNMHTVRSAYLKLRDQGIINLHLGRRAKIAAMSQRPESLPSAFDWRKGIREAVTDALLSGASEQDIRLAVEKQLGSLEKKN